MDSTDPSSATPDIPAPSSFARASPRRLYARLRGCIVTWRARARSRCLLARLDDRMLRDIGIDRTRAWQETGKWFWQP
jgi:uncharacterized protein YjiS (DUF1127 family)